MSKGMDREALSRHDIEHARHERKEGGDRLTRASPSSFTTSSLLPGPGKTSTAAKLELVPLRVNAADGRMDGLKRKSIAMSGKP